MLLLSCASTTAADVVVGDVSIQVEGEYGPIVRFQGQVIVEGSYLQFHSPGWKTMYVDAFHRWRARPAKVILGDLLDGESEAQTVVYGRDILSFLSDMYVYDKLDTDRVWPAYVGQTRGGAVFRIQALRWQNPRPAVDLASIDLVSLGPAAAPVVLAITVEAN